MKSLNSGVSGLKAFQTKMDVIGNNISNVETYGFKSSSVSFSEMLNQQIGSGGGAESAPSSSNQVGLGVRISNIQRDFNQGGLQSTGRETDLAIEGNGFFILSEGGQQFLSRAGNFSFNRDGFLVDQSGRNVQGFNANAAGDVLPSGTTDAIRVDFNSVDDPQATQNVYAAGNLNAETSKPQIVQSQSTLTTDSGSIATGSTALNDLAQTDTDFVNNDTIDFDVTLNDGSTQTISHTFNAGDTVSDLITTVNNDLPAGEATVSLVDGLLVMRSENLGSSELDVNSVTTTGTGSINFPGFQTTQAGQTNSQTVSTTVYDAVGKGHTLTMNMTQTDTNSWEYEASFLDGEEVTSGGTGTISFDQSGNLSSDSTIAMAFDPGGGADEVNFTVNLGNKDKGSRLTQFSGSSSVQFTSQDGYAQGNLVDFNIDGDGYVTGIYNNGRNVNLAQVAIGDVSNYDGLETAGNGLFKETVTSGKISMNTAPNLAETNLNSGVLEGSNVDLANEFTDMITAQRAYQSNARVITTADELLTEAVNLKR
ncbi:flagellar hook protein FlgE [Fodinibius sediminis]|uniref:Flagellar hook protein FlgE n=2 Tax=Fodinibius sediminis TaxID=1214077 RepID=A0A521CIV9_9BACT|nr:flagellar hook protein FlgE [Fodinibius sediminis]